MYKLLPMARALSLPVQPYEEAVAKRGVMAGRGTERVLSEMLMTEESAPQSSAGNAFPSASASARAPPD